LTDENFASESGKLVYRQLYIDYSKSALTHLYWTGCQKLRTMGGGTNGQQRAPLLLTQVVLRLDQKTLQA